MLSHNCLDALFAGSREGVLLLDGEGVIVWGNTAFGECLGRATADLLGRHFQGTLLGEKDAAFAPAEEIGRFLQQIGHQSAPVQVPCCILPGDTRPERSVHLTIQRIGLGVLDNHLLLRLTGAFPFHPAFPALAEERREARNLAQHFLDFFDGMSDIVLHMTPEHVILHANRAVTADAGDDCIGKKCFVVFRGRNLPCENCPVEKSRLNGHEEATQIFTAQERIFAARAFPIPGENGKAITSFLVHEQDQTENRRLQELASQAIPLASLGELAAGVAHEINNPATGIINCAQLLCDRLEGNDNEIAHRILREGERISVIVRNLLSLARVGQEKHPGVKIEEELADLLSLTRAQMRKERIVLIERLAPDLPPLTANSQQIRQVFLNLINNARYSLNQKYPGFNEEKVLEIRGERSSRGVRFTFYDHGSGIPAAVLNRIFQPFFTTKPVGRGTGLGLSISRSIIDDHGGSLEIDSIEGKYARAVIELPVV